MASVNPEAFQLLVLENAKLNAALKASEYEREKLLALVQNLITSQAVFLTLATIIMSLLPPPKIALFFSSQGVALQFYISSMQCAEC